MAAQRCAWHHAQMDHRELERIADIEGNERRANALLLAEAGADRDPVRCGFVASAATARTPLTLCPAVSHPGHGAG